MLENLPLLESQNNAFLIDWVTFVSHSDTVASVKRLLGLAGQDIPWEDNKVFRNGYPMQCSWNGISISYGADMAEFYNDPSKARDDMGICVILSGTGCRAFETYGAGSWDDLFQHVISFGYNVTRLDLAFDDHTGLLDIYRIRQDMLDQNYTSCSRWWLVETGSTGNCVYVGSPQSAIRIRIYDKAAERGFDDGRHWIRVELQLRSKRSLAAAAELVKNHHIGRTVCGILRNYLNFRVPTEDTNKSRWPIAEYWDNMLLDMERISLWISPGEPYNFGKTESWLRDQCGQALLTAMKLHSLPIIMNQIQEKYPVLAPKYERAIAEYQMKKIFDSKWEDT